MRIRNNYEGRIGCVDVNAFKIEVGPANRLFDIQGYVWPKIQTAVVSGQYVQGFPTPLPGMASALAIFGGAKKGGQHVGRFRQP